MRLSFATIAMLALGMNLFANTNAFSDQLTAAKVWNDTELEAADGSKVRFSALASAECLVFVFTRNTCPIAERYEARLNEVTQTFHNQGRVEVVAFNVDDGPGETLSDMRTRSKDHELKFRYLHDPKKIIAKGCGATVTPEVFVFAKTPEGEFALVYRGAIDDSPEEKKVKRHYLKDVLIASLKGSAPTIKKTTARGCAIRYR